MVPSNGLMHLNPTTAATTSIPVLMTHVVTVFLTHVMNADSKVVHANATTVSGAAAVKHILYG